MKRVCVFLFSGTGMTGYVVDKIKLELETLQVSADIFNIEDTQDISINTYDYLGIAYPVHSFNAPQIVINFAKRLPNTKSKSMFILNTAGEYYHLNFASSKLLINILRRKGFDVFYDRQYIMPSNFVIKYDDNMVEQLIGEAKVEAVETAHELTNRVYRRQQSSFFAGLVALIGRAEWFGAKCIGKFFYTDGSCVLCGTCAKNCPNRNISLDKKAIHFGWNCGLCMRCLYICPERSVKVHKPFKFISFDSWYEFLDKRIKK